MFRPRIIPCLLLKDRGFVKTVNFQSPRYVGDPVNAVRILSSKGADEIIILDITATATGRRPPIPLLSQISDETAMPLGIGGGVRTTTEVRELLNSGAEKVIINTHAVEDPRILQEASEIFGSQSIVGSIDAKREASGKYRVYTRAGTKATEWDPVALAKQMEAAGAGEIMVTSIDKDGTMAGYDMQLTRSVADAVGVPVIAAGGAGSLRDMAQIIREGHASAAAAGSLFVFHGRRRAVLISYPTSEEVTEALAGAMTVEG